MVAGGGFDSCLLVKAMTADFVLEVGEVYDDVDGLPFLGAKSETLNLIMEPRLMNRRVSTFTTALNTDQT